ncbi:MAG: carboxylating nicotinate-nucleotide diphosphorylase [Candidatus Riflebacteria bacterium]|nr:carboxylating nicotinate-nucleotide diphosphorylase [Candidatus Riflebacteria bacterium]
MKISRSDRMLAAYGKNPFSLNEYKKIAMGVLEAKFLEDASVDVTVDAVIREDLDSRGVIKSKEDGVLAGLEEISAFYKKHKVSVVKLKKDGCSLKKGDIIAEITGKQSDLLRVERTGLNFLQRMSGIATQTRKLAEITSPHNVMIVGTRKTFFNVMDKNAITLGGGLSHRYGLFDAILIKDNHISAVGEESGVTDRISTALGRAFRFSTKSPPSFIEIETGSMEEAVHAAEAYSDLLRKGVGLANVPFIIMLDNLKPSRINKIVKELKKRKLYDLVLLEASGGIQKKNIEAYAKSGVDAISIGAITHSVPALDISQKIVRVTT